VGTGLLNLPAGVAKSGWVGVPLLTLMALMAAYTALILGKAIALLQHVSSDKQQLVSAEAGPISYGDVGQAALGSTGRWFVTVQMHVTLVGVATIYHLLAALNISSLLSGAAEWITMEWCVLLVAVIVWLHVFLKTLGEVAIVSYFNIAINVALLCTVLVTALQRPPEHAPVTRAFTTDPMAFGSAFASFGFAYGVHPVLPSIRASMHTPRLYPRMALGAFAGTLLFYLPMVIVCYARYGDDVASPVMDTEAVKDAPAVKVVTGAITAHLLMSYPLLAITPESALEDLLHADARRAPLLWRMGVRTLFIGCTALISIIMRTPARFGPLLNLVSSCTSTFTVFILPSLFYIKLRHDLRKPVGVLELCWNVVIVVFAIVGAIFGTIDALTELADTFKRSN